MTLDNEEYRKGLKSLFEGVAAAAPIMEMPATDDAVIGDELDAPIEDTITITKDALKELLDAVAGSGEDDGLEDELDVDVDAEIAPEVDIDVEAPLEEPVAEVAPVVAPGAAPVVAEAEPAVLDAPELDIEAPLDAPLDAPVDDLEAPMLDEPAGDDDIANIVDDIFALGAAGTVDSTTLVDVIAGISTDGDEIDDIEDAGELSVDDLDIEAPAVETPAIDEPVV